MGIGCAAHDRAGAVAGLLRFFVLYVIRIFTLRRGGRGAVDFVRKGDVARGAETAHIRAVFVLDAEEGPHCAAEDFAKGDEEGEDGAVLEVVTVDCVEYPVEAENGVEDHGEIVDPRTFVAEDVAEEGVFGVGVA